MKRLFYITVALLALAAYVFYRDSGVSYETYVFGHCVKFPDDKTCLHQEIQIPFSYYLTKNHR